MLPQDSPFFSADSPCGLYIHVPFCETKCGYCDFFSVALKGRDTSPLIGRLIRELTRRISEANRPITTVFVGGGTPTLLPIQVLEGLLRAIGRLVPVTRLTEFTVEANPATVDDAKAALLVANGVTRVSMGAQSFDPAELATLERLHSPDDIGPSVTTLRRHGLSQINLDLIFGVPGQSLASWLRSLQRAIELAPDHIACYGLTYEPATKLTAMKYAGRLTPCDEDLEADMFLATMDTLEAAGYEQYEISNFARPGCQSRHNLIYWRNQPYIGVGPSAAGCFPFDDHPAASPLSKGGSRGVALRSSDISRRYKNISDVNGYIRMMDEQSHAEIESEMIEGETLMLEMILMQLRLNEGLSIKSFQTRTGINPVDLFGETLIGLVEQGLIVRSQTHVALTPSGRLVANRVIAELAEVADLARQPKECTST